MARTTLIEFRRGTASAWSSANPTLAAGEPGYETDTGKLKIGDGATAWNSLAYFSPGGGGGVSSLDSITGAVTLVAGSGTIISDNSPSAGDITIGVSGTASGAEISYSQITAPVNITSTTEATGTTIISPGAISFSGAAVVVHFFAPYIATTTNAVNQGVIVSLFEGATQITRLCSAFTQSTTSGRLESISGVYRFTPSAGSHTYTVTAFTASTVGTPRVQAGPGGTGADSPAFLRFTYA